MSRRQAERKKAKVKRQKWTSRRACMDLLSARSVLTFSFLLFIFSFLQLHITNISRFQTLQKPHCFVMIELRILRFDHQKETVARRQRKVRRVENRMVRLRQLVQRQHAEHCRERRDQDRAFEGDRDESRPTVEWLAAHVNWIVDHFRPILEKEAAEPAENSANQ